MLTINLMFNKMDGNVQSITIFGTSEELFYHIGRIESQKNFIAWDDKTLIEINNLKKISLIDDLIDKL
jgi:hypothetical protein